MGLELELRHILRIQRIQPSSNNNENNIVLSCPHNMLLMVICNYGFLEIWVAHEFGSV